MCAGAITSLCPSSGYCTGERIHAVVVEPVLLLLSTEYAERVDLHYVGCYQYIQVKILILWLFSRKLMLHNKHCVHFLQYFKLNGDIQAFYTLFQIFVQ